MSRTAPVLAFLGGCLLVACGGRLEADDTSTPTPAPTMPPGTAPSPSTPGAPPGTEPSAPPDAGDPPTGTSKVALTSDGALSVQSGAEQFDISLAILPRTFSKGGLYDFEGDRYPTTAASREALVDDVAFTYGQLAAECAARHPEIVLPKPGDPESVAQKALEAVASCSYGDFGIKPYWIPRLVVDVNVCARKLGDGYRLPTVADVKALTPAERAAIAATVHDGLYNGTEVYVRAADGTVQVGDLVTGAVRALSDTTAWYRGDTYHYEGGAALRCIRR